MTDELTQKGVEHQQTKSTRNVLCVINSVIKNMRKKYDYCRI